ncbi:hypothetical protein ACS0TY_003347 [Phlomoides rotata]
MMTCTKPVGGSSGNGPSTLKSTDIDEDNILTLSLFSGVKSCWFFNITWENLLKGMEFRPEHFITDVYGNIHDFGHLKERAPTMFADGIISEHSPQFVPLH